MQRCIEYALINARRDTWIRGTKNLQDILGETLAAKFLMIESVKSHEYADCVLRITHNHYLFKQLWEFKNN